MSKYIIKTKNGNSFRRAGFQFGREGIEIDAKALSKEQAEALATEPNLIITEAADDGAEARAEKEAAAAAAAQAKKDAAAAAKAEADASKAAAAADKDALAREKKATAKPEGKAAWESASVIAAAAIELTEAKFAALPARDRVAAIESVIAEAAK